MKPSNVKVGVTYVNRGAGTTRRTVLAIGNEHRPMRWYGADPAPNEVGVRFRQAGVENCLYLSAFAQWAKGPIDD